MISKVYGVIPTNPDYWDCECEHDFIHKKSDLEECVECGAHQDDQPDSMISEIRQLGIK